jgi:hypothetical protein
MANKCCIPHSQKHRHVALGAVLDEGELPHGSGILGLEALC